MSSECPAAEAAPSTRLARARAAVAQARVLARVFDFLRAAEPCSACTPVAGAAVCARDGRHTAPAVAATPAWVVRVDVIPGKANLTEKKTRRMVLPMAWRDVAQFLVRWALNDFTTENMILREDSLDARYKSTYTVQAVYPPPVMRPAWSAAAAARRRDELNDAISGPALEAMWSELLVKAGVTATPQPFRALVQRSVAARRQGQGAPPPRRGKKRAAKKKRAARA